MNRKLTAGFALTFLLLAHAGAAETTPPVGMGLVPAALHRPFYEPESTPARRVAAFWLDEKTVTNAEFLEFVREKPAWRKSQVKRVFADASYLGHWIDDLNPGDEDQRARPVVQVSWFAARAYARWKGKRLPTLEEWEVAACASETAADASRDEAFRRRILDWYSKPNPARPPLGGTQYKTLHGIWDLHGGVWEWTENFNSVLLSGESRGDAANESGLFCGGGAANASEKGDYAAFLRYAMRASLRASYTTANLGFRCARDADPPGESP